MSKIFAIQCRTGCTCCRSDNHFRGLYLTREEAQARIDRFRRGIDNPVASQYSRYGQYSIEEEDCEEISGDRIIVGNKKVYFKSQIATVNLEDGSLLNWNKEQGDDYLESCNEY